MFSVWAGRSYVWKGNRKSKNNYHYNWQESVKFLSVHILSYKERNLGCKILYCARESIVCKTNKTTSNWEKKQTQFCVFSFLYIRMSKNKRENLFFLSQWLHSRDSNSKFLFWTGQAIFTARARERDGFWYKATFFEAYHHARERLERAQCSEKREWRESARLLRRRRGEIA